MINKRIVFILAGILVLAVVVVSVYALTEEKAFARKLLGDKLTEEQFEAMNLYTNELNNVPEEDKWKVFLEILNGKRLNFDLFENKVKKIEKQEKEISDEGKLTGDVLNVMEGDVDKTVQNQVEDGG